MTFNDRQWERHDSDGAAARRGRRSGTRLCRVLGTLLLLLPLCHVGAADLPPPPEQLRVLSYNVHNFTADPDSKLTSAQARDAVIDVLADIAADVMVLYEIGGEPALAEIRKALAARGRPYPFASVVEATDRERQIAFLAAVDPTQVSHDITAFYSLGGRHVPVRRGFGHCVFQWNNGYRLHIVGAHLKSKVFHYLGQTDMRRYEARQLRYLFNTIIEQDPEANVLVVGDMNDSPNSSPVATLCGRRYKGPKQLYDLRPVDSYGMSWTHLWSEADTYSRIDYAFASYYLLPEIRFEDTGLPLAPEWAEASDHRPVLVSLTPHTKPVTEALLLQFDRNTRQPTPPAEERQIGTRKVRR